MKPNFSYIEEKARDILKRNDCYVPNFDIKILAKQLNIKLIAKDLGDDVSGFFVMTDTDRVITYNKKNNSNRRRFTIAHEIGHATLHSKDQPIFVDKAPTVMFRNTLSSTGEDYREREANAFAASLLIPKELLEDNLPNAPYDINNAIRFLADTFGVSENAMAFRLSNLGYGV